MKRTTVFDDMNRLLEEMRHTVSGDRFAFGEASGDVSIRTDADDGEYVVHADLPGFETSEIDLRFDDGRMTIDAHHERTGDGETWARRVHETVPIPGTVDVDGIEASYNNGVLEVRFPVEDATESGHHIEIE